MQSVDLQSKANYTSHLGREGSIPKSQGTLTKRKFWYYSSENGLWRGACETFSYKHFPNISIKKYAVTSTSVNTFTLMILECC